MFQAQQNRQKSVVVHRFFGGFAWFLLSQFDDSHVLLAAANDGVAAVEEVGFRQFAVDALDLFVVHVGAALADGASRSRQALAEARSVQHVQDAEVVGRHLDDWQFGNHCLQGRQVDLAQFTSAEDRGGSSDHLGGSVFAVHQAGYLPGKLALGQALERTLSNFHSQGLDMFARHEGEDLKTVDHICIGGV